MNMARPRAGPGYRPRRSGSGKTSSCSRPQPAGYREYDPAILERLAFIRQCQAAGLTLEQIRQVLGIRDGGRPPCVHVTGPITRRLAKVEARLADLARTRDQLTALAARAAAQDPADCQGYYSIIVG